MMEILLSIPSAVAAIIFSIWLAILIFFKRRRNARVSMATIWTRLIAEGRVSSTRSMLRRALSILFALLICFGATHYLAAKFFPQVGEPASRKAIDLVCILDTSPSTLRLRAEGGDTLSALVAQVKQELSALEEVDRAWLMWRERGRVLTSGPYAGGKVSAGEWKRLEEFIEADFVGLGARPYRDALSNIAFETRPWVEDAEMKAWPDAEALFEQERERHLSIFTDHDQHLISIAEDQEWLQAMQVASVRKHQLGAHGVDYRFTGMEYQADGRLKLSGNFPEEIEITYLDGSSADGSNITRNDEAITLSTAMPLGKKGLRIRLSDQGDALPENNTLEIKGGRPKIKPRIAIRAKSSFYANSIQNIFQRLLPESIEAEVVTYQMRDLLASVVVSEEAEIAISPEYTKAVIYMGELPAKMGIPSSPAIPKKHASATLTMPSAMVGEADQAQVHEIEVTQASIADYPQDEGWQVLLEVKGLGPLIAFRPGAIPILHVATTQLGSNLFAKPAVALLVRRWISPLLLPSLDQSQATPVYRNGDVLPIPFAEAEISIRPTSTQMENRHWSWRRGEKGESGFADTWVPGIYHIQNSDPESPSTRNYQTFWFVDPQEVPSGSIPAVEISDLQLTPYVPAQPLIPKRALTLILLITLLLVVVEWAFYWFGLSE